MPGGINIPISHISHETHLLVDTFSWLYCGLYPNIPWRIPPIFPRQPRRQWPFGRRRAPEVWVTNRVPRKIDGEDMWRLKIDQPICGPGVKLWPIPIGIVFFFVGRWGFRVRTPACQTHRLSIVVSLITSPMEWKRNERNERRRCHIMWWADIFKNQVITIVITIATVIIIIL